MQNAEEDVASERPDPQKLQLGYAIQSPTASNGPKQMSKTGKHLIPNTDEAHEHMAIFLAAHLVTTWLRDVLPRKRHLDGLSISAENKSKMLVDVMSTVQFVSDEQRKSWLGLVFDVNVTHLYDHSRFAKDGGPLQNYIGRFCYAACKKELEFDFLQKGGNFNFSPFSQKLS